MRQSNCLIFAIALYWRRRRHGHEGYLILRRSRWGPFPHMLYGERRADGTLRVVSYKPADPTRRKKPPPVFQGSSIWGDNLDGGPRP